MSELEMLWPAATGAPLDDREVHVFTFPLLATEEQIAGFAATLSNEERERAAQFRVGRLRERYVVGRGVMRAVLASYLDCEPAGMEFTYSARGKPALAGVWAETLHFNLAHSHDLALLAVTRAAPVGVDVERIRPMRDGVDIAERFFSPRESALLRGVPEAERDAAFFTLWSRKEAWLKATGEGIAASLSNFEVSFLPDEPTQVLEIADEPRSAQEWSLWGLQPAKGYVGAIAMRVRAGEVKCYRWV